MNATAVPTQRSAAARRESRRVTLFGPLNEPIADWHGRRVWLVGASSGIGEALGAALHAAGAQVFLSARSADALQAFAARHAGAVAVPLDACDADAVRAGAQQVLQSGPLDMVVYCAGYYRAMRATAFSLPEMRRHQDVNYTGALNVLDAVLPGLLEHGGHISLISSVAGFRGLPNSLAYGPTKSALTTLAETLHIDLRELGVSVSVIHPGFVETPLTAQNRFRMPALITPAQAADAILAGWRAGRFDIHFPRRFTLGMKALRLLPFRLHRALIKRWTGL